MARDPTLDIYIYILYIYTQLNDQSVSGHPTGRAEPARLAGGARLGSARLVGFWDGSARLGSRDSAHGSARLGSCDFGTARLGSARAILERLGSARPAGPAPRKRGAKC